MLLIHQAQFATLQRSQELAFRATLVASLREHYPERTGKATDVQIGKFLNPALAHARQAGIEGEADLTEFCCLYFEARAYGRYPESPDWLSQILNEPSTDATTKLMQAITAWQSDPRNPPEDADGH